MVNWPYLSFQAPKKHGTLEGLELDLFDVNSNGSWTETNSSIHCSDESI